MSKTHDMIKLAHFKGYRVTPAGEVLNSNGKPRILRLATSNASVRYLVFSLYTPDGAFPVHVHKLQAYQKFGEAMFEPNIVVRHLDGNSLNNAPDNIAIGTITDNAMDRPKLDRSLHAQLASKAASRRSDETWEAVRADYAAGLGYKKLEKKYGIGRSTLSYQLSKKAAYRTLANREPIQ